MAAGEKMLFDFFGLLAHGRHDPRSKSIMETLTWRVAASTDTLIIAWGLTDNFKVAGSIMSIEIVTKMFLYYAHERQWEKPKFNQFVISTHNKVGDLLGL